MGRKIFVSYKYSDSDVLGLPGINNTTARNYVDELDDIIEEEGHIYKGEDDGEDMSTLADPTIGSKLGDKIFDSSVTIVLISKGMREDMPDKEQWIPWEIRYSLREQSREGGRSKTNAVLAVVLPDELALYDYFLTYNQRCNSVSYNFADLFQILKDNMFNIKDPEKHECNGTVIYTGKYSYIHSVKWSEFIKNPSEHIDIALDIRQNIDKYDIVKTIKDE